MITGLKSPRIDDPGLMRLLKLQYDECEVTGVTRDLHLHHVIYKGGALGDDVRANIVCVNRDLHQRIHAGDKKALYLLGALVDRRRHDTARYIEAKLGGAPALLEWFKRHGIGD